jgi:hypothetical protein
LKRLRETMDLMTFDSAWSKGQGMKMEQAIELAVEGIIEGIHE